MSYFETVDKAIDLTVVTDDITGLTYLEPMYKEILRQNDVSLEDEDELYELLKLSGVDKYVSFDMGMVSKYNYYTGIIFAGYTFGSGEAVVNGGRYDKLVSCFGKEYAATGFAIIVDQLYAALNRQQIPLPYQKTVKWFLYDERGREDAIRDAQALRRRGEVVKLMKVSASRTKEDYEAHARAEGVQDIIYYLLGDR